MATVTPLSTGTSVRLRLARIEGQTAGLRRMWDEDRPAENLLDQIASVRKPRAASTVAQVRTVLGTVTACMSPSATVM